MLLYTQKRWVWLSDALKIPFIPQDAVVNVIVLTMFSFERPKEWLVTTRLKRWKTLDDDTYRSRFGWFMCNILNNFDEGHC